MSHTFISFIALLSSFPALLFSSMSACVCACGWVCREKELRSVAEQISKAVGRSRALGPWVPQPSPILLPSAPHTHICTHMPWNSKSIHMCVSLFRWCCGLNDYEWLCWYEIFRYCVICFIFDLNFWIVSSKGKMSATTHTLLIVIIQLYLSLYLLKPCD